MEKTLTISGLVIAGLIGLLLGQGLGVRPTPEGIAGWLTPITAVAAVAQTLFALVALSGLRHARAQANAASTGLEVMRDTAERQLRAYVSLETVSLVPLVAGHPLRASLTFRNTGQTPAMSVTCLAHVQFGPADVEVFPPALLGDLADRASRRTAGAGQPIMQTAYTDQPLDAEHLEHLETGEARFVICGTVSYRDIFGKDRETEFHVNVHSKNPHGLLMAAPSAYGNNAT